MTQYVTMDDIVRCVDARTFPDFFDRDSVRRYGANPVAEAITYVQTRHACKIIAVIFGSAALSGLVMGSLPLLMRGVMGDAIFWISVATLCLMSLLFWGFSLAAYRMQLPEKLHADAFLTDLNIFIDWARSTIKWEQKRNPFDLFLEQYGTQEGVRFLAEKVVLPLAAEEVLKVRRAESARKESDDPAQEAMAISDFKRAESKALLELQFWHDRCVRLNAIPEGSWKKWLMDAQDKAVIAGSLATAGL